MYTYRLQPYAGTQSRHTCPKCGRKRVFTLYVHADTGQPISHEVGRCDRVLQCGYEFKPKDFFRQHGISQMAPAREKKYYPFTKAYSTLEYHYLEQSQTHQPDNLMVYLSAHLPESAIRDIRENYHTGTSKLWPGATVFWQVDRNDTIRTGKIMLYNPETGRRVKQPFNHISWVHKRLNIKNFELQQCMFGEHRLPDFPDKTLAIVESEKTAMIASVYMPDYLWLALGGLHNLNQRVVRILKKRNVLFYPDANGYQTWQQKLHELKAPSCFMLSDLLEQVSSDEEKTKGYDLADYLMQYEIRKPASVKTTADEKRDQPSLKLRLAKEESVAEPQTMNFYGRAMDLLKFFETTKVPTGPIRPNNWTTIYDASLFVNSHFNFAATYGDTRIGNTYLDHLEELREWVEGLAL